MVDVGVSVAAPPDPQTRVGSDTVPPSGRFPRAITAITVGLLAITTTVSACLMVAAGRVWYGSGFVANSSGGLTAVPEATLRALEATAMALGPSYIVTGIAFIVWFASQRTFAERLGFGGTFRHHRAWAVFGWFVPVAVLFIPPRVMNDLWRAGRHQVVEYVPARHGLWWGCFILMNVAASATLPLAETATDPEAARWVLLALSLEMLLMAVTGILALTIVVDVNHRLQARRRVLHPTSGPAAAAATLSPWRQRGLAVAGLALLVASSFAMVLPATVVATDAGGFTGASASGPVSGPGSQPAHIDDAPGELVALMPPESCFDLEETKPDEPWRGTRRPCTVPHEMQVYAVVDLHDDAPPTSDEKLGAEAEESCLQRFAEYVGVSYAESLLEVLMLHPTTESWKQGDRRVVCLLSRPEGELLKTSARGSGI
jgi:hypothetical protein